MLSDPFLTVYNNCLSLNLTDWKKIIHKTSTISKNELCIRNKKILWKKKCRCKNRHDRKKVSNLQNMDKYDLELSFHIFTVNTVTFTDMLLNIHELSQ